MAGSQDLEGCWTTCPGHASAVVGINTRGCKLWAGLVVAISDWLDTRCCRIGGRMFDAGACGIRLMLSEFQFRLRAVARDEN